MTAPAFSADRLHREDVVEAHLVDRLVTLQGWRERAPEDYDRRLALDPDMVVAFVRATQPDAWARLEGQYPDRARDELLRNLVGRLEATGTLEVLRKGVTIIPGIPVRLCAFQPASRLNADLQREYEANILSVTRQLRYSPKNENAIDVGLFVNGIPVATLELKNTLTGTTWRTAENQYREDRSPTGEPLLTFRRGALVHFALDEHHVSMTTRLQNGRTRFLPFNLGRDGGAGNPDIAGDFRIGYLYADQPEGKAIFSREVLLDILGRFMHLNEEEQPDGSVKTAMLWPRFHQLDAVRKLAAHARANGPGQAYLFEHSAGSGKSNTIGWSAHRLISLHDEADRSIFDSVIIVTDRVVLDRQLQKTVATFAQTPGVARAIDGTSAQLKAALEAGARIVISTIHKFSTDRLKELIGQKGKRFFVIIDEAHSSQSGQQATALAEALTRDEIDKRYDVLEEAIRAAQAARGPQANVSYCAFTATPRNVTLERFGTKGADGLPRPFHLYSMRQAIEEGFILDVLTHYTSYKTAFTLAHRDTGEVVASPEVDPSAAMKGIMGWVRLHEYNIAQRVQVVIEHYRRHVQHLLGGRAKAMVVTGSRKEAVRWQLEMRRYIAAHGYRLDALVAFSGEVDDPDSGPEPFTEASAALNPRLHGQDIRTAFKGGGYHLLLVANKFQTGFDEPLLCAMYVDKRLGGIQAVQTLSRLNRCHPGKDTTYVVDFVNDPQEILAAFRRYHQTAELADVTDPDTVFTLLAKLDGQALYDRFEVERVVRVVLQGERARQSDLDAALMPVAQRLLTTYTQARHAFDAADAGSPARQQAKDRLDALILFRRDLGAYLRLYGFLSQIFDYGNTDVEKRAIFFKGLLPLLTFGREREGVDLSALRLTAYTLKDMGQAVLDLRQGQPEKIQPTSEPGSGSVQDKQKVLLDELIARVNSLFEGDLSPGDKLVYVNSAIKGKLKEYPELVLQATHNTKEQFASSPDLERLIEDAIMDVRANFSVMSDQALASDELRAQIRDILLGPGRLYEELRQQVG